jgi:hypothetical protein
MKMRNKKRSSFRDKEADKAETIEKYNIKNQQKSHLIRKLKELVVLFHRNDFISRIISVFALSGNLDRPTKGRIKKHRNEKQKFKTHFCLKQPLSFSQTLLF